MRKVFYYISPFIMVPATLFLGDCIVRATNISMFFPYFFAVPILLYFHDPYPSSGFFSFIGILPKIKDTRSSGNPKSSITS